jgi:hypothetical protein
MRWMILVVLFAGLARAQDLGGQALLDGDYARARDLAAPATNAPSVPTRAEAFRVLGLASFGLGQRDDAEAALLAYLKLAPDAHLDPALYPPEMLVFFEDVRARHAGELLIVKPRPQRKKTFVLNLVPPFGQIQNGDAGRAWLFGSAELVFLSVNVTTWAMLRSDCADDLTCQHSDRSRTLRTVNLISGGLFLATWAAGVVDGFIGYPARPELSAEHARRFGFQPVTGGGLATVAGTF